MKISIVLAAVILAASSMAFAGNNGGDKGGKDGNSGSTARGDGINLDGSADDAHKCRAGVAGAALCREGMKNKSK